METEGLGFIRDKLEIKLLILYVLKQLPAKVSFNELPGLVLVDGGFDYFQFSQCLSELVDTGHVLKDSDFYSITEKGTEHLDALESRLPYSVKVKAKKHAAPTAARMKRDALVLASHQVREDGTCMLKLSLSDDIGEVMKLRLLTDSEDRAVQMEKNFHDRAEEFYLELIRILSPDKL